MYLYVYYIIFLAFCQYGDFSGGICGLRSGVAAKIKICAKIANTIEKAKIL